MGNAVFGKPKKEVKEVIEENPPKNEVNIHEKISTFEKKKLHIENIISYYNKKATESVHNKNESIQFLKRKQTYEKQLQTITAMIFKLESMRDACEFMTFEKDMVEAVKHANSVLKKSELTADEVNTMMDDSDELLENCNDISEAILSHQTMDPDIENEYEKMVAELPAPPTHIPVVEPVLTTAPEPTRVLVPA